MASILELPPSFPWSSRAGNSTHPGTPTTSWTHNITSFLYFFRVSQQTQTGGQGPQDTDSTLSKGSGHTTRKWLARVLDILGSFLRWRRITRQQQKGGPVKRQSWEGGVPRGRLLAHPCMLGSRTYTHEQLPLVNDTSVGTCGTRRGGNEEDSVVILSATPNNAEDVSEGP